MLPFQHGGHLLTDHGMPVVLSGGALFAVSNFTQSLNSEILTTGNCTSDPYGNEANSTSGWFAANVTNTSQGVEVNVGSYALQAEATSTSFPRAYLRPVLTAGNVYLIQSDCKRGIGSNQQVGPDTSMYSIGFPSHTPKATWDSHKMLCTATVTGINSQRWYAAFTGGSIGDIIYVDNVSWRQINLNTQQTSKADGIHYVWYAVPISPVIGTSFHIIYRISDGNTIGSMEHWDAYVEYDGSQWNIRLDSVTGGTPTNRIGVAGIGSTNGIKVEVDGTIHTLYTTNNGGVVWTLRGSVSVSHQDTATKTNILYTTDTTPLLWESYG